MSCCVAGRDEIIDLRMVESEEISQGWRGCTSQRLAIRDYPSQISPLPSCRVERPLLLISEPLDYIANVLGVSLPLLSRRLVPMALLIIVMAAL
jgi:hypothetical protein